MASHDQQWYMDTGATSHISSYTGCHILSPLKKLCPQSLGRNLCRGCRVGEKVRVFLLHLVFTLPSEHRTSPGVPEYFDNWNTTLLQTLDLMVHNLDGFFDETLICRHLGSSSNGYRHSGSSAMHFFNFREWNVTMNSTHLLWSLDDRTRFYFGNDLK
ncbi:hypothetical protein Tco_1072601 [Tanacetum coccineum]